MAANTSLLINIGAKTGGAVSGIDKVNRKLDDFGDTADKVSRRSKGFAAGIEQATGPALAAMTALTAAMGYAVVQASKLEQSSGALASVFKDSTGEMEAAAKAAQQIGLSQSDYSQIAAVLGSQLRNLGVEQGKLAPETQKVIGLGADLAAQFGGPTSDAVEALSALFRGERDPIEKYGVSIKQADVDARLAQKGLSGLTGEAEKQAETLAVMELLWEQTADAQGAAERETNTFEGTMGRLRATMDNLAASVGQKVLPYLTGLADQAQKLAVWVGANVDVVIALAASFGTLASGILAARGAMIAFNIVAAINPWVLLGIAVAAVVAGLVIAYQKFEPLQDAVSSIADAIKPLADDLLPKFAQLWEDLQPKLKEFADELRPVVEENMPKLRDALAAIGAAYVDYLEWWLPRLVDVLSVALPAAIKYVTVALQAFVAGLVFAGSAVAAVADWVRDFWAMTEGVRSALGTMLQIVQTVFGFVYGVVSSVVGLVVEAVAAGFGQVQSVVSVVSSAVLGVVSAAWNAIWGNVSNIVGSIIAVVTGGFSAILSVVFGSSEQGRQAVSSAWNAMVEAIRSALNTALGVVVGLAAQIVSALTSGFSGGADAGRQMVQNLIDGIKGMAASAVQAARDLAADVIAALGGALGGLNPVSVITGGRSLPAPSVAPPPRLLRAGGVDPTAQGASTVGRLSPRAKPATVNVFVDGVKRRTDADPWRRNYTRVAV